MNKVDRMLAKLEEHSKDLNNLLEWHEKYEGELYCPFCGAPPDKVKTNGNGFHRCKGKCKNNFYLLRCTE